MEAFFGANTEREPDWIRTVSGISGLREYLEQAAVGCPLESIIVDNISPKELKKFHESVVEYINFTNNSFFQPDAYSIKGNPVMLSLAIKEYEITEMLLEQIEGLTIRKCGRIAKDMAYGFNTPYGISDHEECFPYRNSEYCILNLLYEPEFVRETIRSKLMSRLEKEANDLYDFSFFQTRSFKNEDVKKQLALDMKNYPKLFEKKSLCYARDMASMIFLLKVFEDDNHANYLLANNSIGLYSIIYLQVDQKANIESDMKKLEQVVGLLQNRKKTHKELICFMLKLITELRSRKMLDEQDEEYFIDAENSIWNKLAKLSIPEKELYKLLGADRRKEIRIELIYEYASRILGKELTCFLPDEITYIEYVFGLNNDNQDMYQSGFSFGFNQSEIKGRLFRLINHIGSIQHSKKSLQDMEQLGKDIGSFLISNSENLKDVFAELLIKGFIPSACLDLVIKKANNNKKCAYMRPLLIAYKYGGLGNDEG